MMPGSRVGLDATIVTEDKFDRAFAWFQRRVEGRLRSYGPWHLEGLVPVEHPPIPVAIVDINIDSDLASEFNVGKGTVGFSLWGTGPAMRDRMASAAAREDHVLYASISSVPRSRKSMASVLRDFGPLVRSLIRTHEAARFSTYSLDELGNLPALRTKFWKPRDQDEGPDESKTNSLSVAPRELSEPWKFIENCLTFFYSRPGKGDSVEGRIRSAIQLLMEADRQWHAAVALALCCSAMEALLSRRGNNTIAQSLADHCALVLEPESEKRLDAEEYVKELYDRRSRAMHGDSLVDDKTTLAHARRLAAMLLLARLERWSHMAAYGGENQEEFFNEVQKSRLTAKSIEGISYTLKPDWRFE
jgi:hypothetical protein